MKILFVSWDGPGTTYHETIFLPILAAARSEDDEIFALQFTWESPGRSERNQRLAEELGVGYEAYEIAGESDVRRLGGTFAGGIRRLITLVHRHDVDVILARSVIPALLVMVVRCLLPFRRLRLIYDADGLPADERVEFGDWTERCVRYRVFRAVEYFAVRTACAVLVRSEAAKRIIHHRTACDPRKLFVVVNGRDSRLFESTAQQRSEVRKSLGIPERSFVSVYQGSLGPQYLPHLIFQTFSAIERHHASGSHALVLTPECNHQMVRRLAEAHGVTQLTLIDATPTEVATYLPCADLGIAYRAPTLSQSAVSPIKVAEYLLAGVPVAYTAETGDLDRILDGEVGIQTIDDATAAEEVARWTVEHGGPRRDHTRCTSIALGRHRFSQSIGAHAYRRAIFMLTTDRGCT